MKILMAIIILHGFCDDKVIETGLRLLLDSSYSKCFPFASLIFQPKKRVEKPGTLTFQRHPHDSFNDGNAAIFGEV